MAPYRREISDACNWHQEQALTSTIYILYQTGPTGFLLKEEGESKNFKVFLGDPHSCTCSVFKKEKDLCKHICWALLKKFRVDRNDPLSWQLGLNEREINQMLRGDTSNAARTRNKPTNGSQKVAQLGCGDCGSNGRVEQRPITDIDVCPICQDELLAKKLPVSYCKFGCGNNVHIKCMKVWADHQKSNGESQLKCPLCREQFSTFEMLELEYRNNSLNRVEKQDVHYGLVCNSCKSTPLVGKSYKCTQCAEFYLCQNCFNTDSHKTHSFVFREKLNQKYRPATRDHVGLIPNALAQELARRDLVDADYELLTQLGASESTVLSQIPEKVIKSWPTEKIRPNNQLLSPGHQCRVCLRAFQIDQLVRRLPGCKHRFHVDCIDNWLLHSHPTCPIDGLVVWDPVTAHLEKAEKLKKDQPPKPKTSSNNDDDISMGIIINYKPCGSMDNNKAKNCSTAEINKKFSLPKRVSSFDSKSKPNSAEIKTKSPNIKLTLPSIEVRGTRLANNPAVDICFTESDSDPMNVNRLIKLRPYQLTRVDHST